MAKETKDADGGDRAPFLKGGNNSMHSARGTGTQTPGQSSQEGSSAIGSPQNVQAGPSSVAGFTNDAGTNKDHAGTQTPGVSGATKKGGDAKFASGGSTPMFGNRGSLPARGGYTTPG
jgi:hypothetical protein